MAIETKQVGPINEQQTVISGTDVLLSVTVGNAQIGGSFIQDLDGKQIAKGDITNHNLGDGASLKGKKITVFTNVLDVNPINNGVVILHHFTNINNDFLFTEIAPEDGIVSFIVNYSFI